MLQDTVVFVCVVSSALVTWLYITCPLVHVPGPWHTRITGLVDFINTARGRRALAVDEMHKKYGPIVRVTPTMASLWSPEAVKTIYGSSKSRPFNKDPFSALVFNFRGPEHANLVGLANAREAAQRRKFYGSVFSRGSLLNMYDSIGKALGRYDKRLQEWNEKSIQVDFALATRMTALDVITEVAFAGHYKGGDSLKLTHMMDAFVQANVLRAAAPAIYKLLKTIPVKTLKWVHSVDEFCDLGEQSVDDYLAARNKGDSMKDGRKDCMAPLVDYRDEEGVSLNRKQLNIEAVQLIIGGTDTTANTTAYTAWEIARNQEIAKLLVDELASLTESVPSVQALEDLPYLSACLQEGLRLHCVLPGPTPRIVPDGGADIMGVHFPGGCQVFVQAHTAHQDASIFPDPEKFDPSRWIKNGNEAKMQLAMIGFSAGPRICLGMMLAWMEMRYMIAQLFRNYHVEVSANNKMYDKVEYLLIAARDGKCNLDLRPKP